MGADAAADGAAASGPLVGVKVVELAGIGPAPFCAMMLSDMGAEVIRVDRASAVPEQSADQSSSDQTNSDQPSPDPLNRGRRSVAVDLKQPAGVEAVLRLAQSADILLEGFRPGVAERLGVGPQVCLEKNPKLVYGRMTGWGQSGPYASAAGHDINYIALSGALGTVGAAGGPPVPAVNYLGDFGGGGLLLAFGLVCALMSARQTGEGQVVDAAMVDGSALLATMVYGMHSLGVWGQRGENLLDGGAFYYGVYECADGEYVSIGSLEPQFYQELIRLTGADETKLPAQGDSAAWPEARRHLEEIFLSKTRAQWCEIMEGSDVCFAPVLSLDEAPRHPHNVSRGSFMQLGDLTLPAPAPRFSLTPPGVQRPAPHPGQHSRQVLSDWGFSDAEFEELRAQGVVRELGVVR